MQPVDRPSRFSFRQTGLVLALGTLTLLSGCATGPGENAKAKFIFFPPPPAPPRVQYLTSFSGGQDPGAVSGGFAAFVIGQEASSVPILKPYGVDIASNQLFICDTGARAVDVLDLNSLTLRRFAPVGNNKLGVPINIVIDTDGSRYVTDTARNQVLHFSADDQLLGLLDGTAFGTNIQRFTGVALTKDWIYATDINGHCVRVFDKATHQPIFTIPRNPQADAESDPGHLFMPVNVALDRQNRVYVSDMAACRVKVFDATGIFLRTIGGQGDLPGQFARPKGITVDHAGRVFVVDAASQTCQVFDAAGKLLLTFGEPGGNPAEDIATLNLPAAIRVDYDHLHQFQAFAAPGFVLEELIIISNQLGAQKISVFGLGHKE
ncbi:MAG: 6-bladed beta-propeller [Verrucomicrobiota bacterium]